MADAKTQSSSPHGGHRQRLLAQCAAQQFDGMPAHQVLEALLFYCIPRRDTNELAHRLLARFGTLAGVLDAPPEELCTVDGMGPRSAEFLALLPPLFRRYSESRSDLKLLQTPEDIAAFIVPRFIGRSEEAVLLVCLDGRRHVNYCDFLFKGSLNAAGVSVRLVVETALRHGAVAVILAHNHPAGLAIPSQADLATTTSLERALSTVGIVLVDHLLVAGDAFISFRDSGFLR